MKNLLSKVFLAGIMMLQHGCDNKKDEQTQSDYLIRLVTTEYNYQMPDTINSGFHLWRLVNNGALWHEAVIFRFTNDTSSINDYVDEVKRGIDFPSFSLDYGGPGMTLPKDSHELIMQLSPGRYGIVCTIDNHMMAGMSKEFFVQQKKDEDTTQPPHEDVILTLSDTGFHFSKTISAGKHLIKIVNAGPQYHEVDFIKLDEGKTKSDYVKWYHDSIPVPGKPVGGSLDFIPGFECWFPVNLAPGDYLLSCMVPDSATGKSHIDEGILGEFAIR